MSVTVSSLTRRVRIINDEGLHLRAAFNLAQVAAKFQAQIFLQRNCARADAKSIMSILSLAASKGVEFEVIVEGIDAQHALDTIVQLFARGFETE